MSDLPATPQVIEAAALLVSRLDEIDALLELIEKLEVQIRVLRNSFGELARSFPRGSLPIREECLELLEWAEESK